VRIRINITRTLGSVLKRRIVASFSIRLSLPE